MELALLTRAIFALLLVLGLVGLLAWAARRWPRALALSQDPTARRRLRVIERLPLDARRQIIIVADGAREHVILLGAAGESIVESRNRQADPASPAVQATAQPSFAEAAE